MTRQISLLTWDTSEHTHTQKKTPSKFCFFFASSNFNDISFPMYFYYIESEEWILSLLFHYFIYSIQTVYWRHSGWSQQPTRTAQKFYLALSLPQFLCVYVYAKNIYGLYWCDSFLQKIDRWNMPVLKSTPLN